MYSCDSVCECTALWQQVYMPINFRAFEFFKVSFSSLFLITKYIVKKDVRNSNYEIDKHQECYTLLIPRFIFN